MSVIVVDVDNQYCEELNYSYQLILENDNTYTVYISYDVLSGKYYAKGLETFAEAWQKLSEAMGMEELLDY